MEAISPDSRTPIMLTQHTYFNLDALPIPLSIKYGTIRSTCRTLIATLQLMGMPYRQAKLSIYISRYSIFDFWSTPRQFGLATSRAEFANSCGNTCNGFNGEWLIDSNTLKDDVVVKLNSNWNGIDAELRTNQAGIVLYTCYWMDGQILMKSTRPRRRKQEYHVEFMHCNRSAGLGRWD